MSIILPWQKYRFCNGFSSTFEDGTSNQATILQEFNNESIDYEGAAKYP